MLKHTKNNIKFNKLLELIFKLKIKLLDSSYEKEIVEIDQRAKALFDIYNTSKTLKQEVNTKIKNLSKQNAYLKYEHYINKEKE